MLKTRAIARAYSAEMHSGFADLREQLSMDFARRLPLPTLRDTTKAQIARILEAWSSALAERHPADSCSAASRSPIACTRRSSRVSQPMAIEVPAPVQSYMDRMMALPAMRDWGVAALAEVEAGKA